MVQMSVESAVVVGLGLLHYLDLVVCISLSRTGRFRLL